MQVHEIMSTNVSRIDQNSTIRDAAIAMRDQDLGALPVCDGDRMLGMVTDRDIAVRGIAMDRPPSACSVSEVMSEGVCYVRDDDPIETAERLMCDHQIRRLPVVNADNRLVGIVTIADLAKAGQHELSEEALESVVQPSGASRKM